MAVKSALRLFIARENLQHAAGQPGLTQPETAAARGVSQSVVSTLMTRRSTQVHFDTIDRLCAYLNVESGNLFVRESESSNLVP